LPRRRLHVSHPVRAFLLLGMLGLVVIPALRHSAANRQILLIIDAKSNRHPISPYIYGVNEGLPSTLRDLNIKLNRWGGNRATRYNWKEDTTSTAADWYFQNLKSGPNRPEDDWKYKDYELFIRDNRQNNCDSLITIPMIGRVAKDDKSKSFSVAKYGAQHSVAPEDNDAGDGIKPDGSHVDNDPNDSSVVADIEFQRDWVKQIVRTFGSANSNGVKFYTLDNEPDLWNDIHRDLHPKPAGYDEIFGLSKNYAQMIKSVDPSAQITGPALSHWSSYFNSSVDNFNHGKDRKSHGDAPFLEWYLSQMRKAEKETGRRLLDYVDIHFYPETRAGKNHERIVLDSEDEGDADIQAARLRSTRALWDSTYDDESWIKQPVRLIPWLKETVAKTYPGTKIAITEYKWGPDAAITSAIAQADALGLFGREGIDMAAFWNAGSERFQNSPPEFAFKMYLNYDGQHGAFGDISVAAHSSDQDALSIYSSVDSKNGDLIVVLINKTTQTLFPAFEVRNFTGKAIAEFRYSEQDVHRIIRLPIQQEAGFGQFSKTGFPARSITVLRFQP